MIVAPELELVVTVAGFVCGPEVVCVVLLLPSTAPPPPPPEVAEACERLPVHVAPVGQHAMFLAWSVVHTEPAVQHAAP